MDRRQALETTLRPSPWRPWSASVGRSPRRRRRATGATDAGIDPTCIQRTGADTNAGTRDSPLRTLAAAARRVSEGKEPGRRRSSSRKVSMRSAKPARFAAPNRSFTRTARLTIRAEVLPDDPEWHTGRMPTLIHTMPLSTVWNGRPDPFGGVAYGMEIETSHVTVQGLKILGMPVVEHPKPGIIHRVYPIGRNGRDLDDLEIKQCLFAGDEVTNPNHLGILANGTGIVLDHCVFHGLKQPVVYWSGGSTGHAMRNCLVYGAYGCGIWTSGIANDFEYRNNVVANSNYVWIGQSAAQPAPRQDRGQVGRATAVRPCPRPPRRASPFTTRSSTASSQATRSSPAPAAGRPSTSGTSIPPSWNSSGPRCQPEPVTLELDQTKRNYLHPVEGSEAAAVGAGLFTRTS